MKTTCQSSLKGLNKADSSDTLTGHMSITNKSNGFVNNLGDDDKSTKNIHGINPKATISFGINSA